MYIGQFYLYWPITSATSLFAREGVWESKDLLVIMQALGEADGVDWKEL